ncbi:MAG TPA: DUF4148 domain-containing protein [Burkholderiales bacterium]|jgi:hypothetical protein|nr:DUF4148 domain-containing protein [Burkholderiales bacterium]
MKPLIRAVVVAAVLAPPAISFAQQSDAPITRAQVYDQLVQIEQAGFDPRGGEYVYYPADVEAALARLAAQSAAAR